jgi:hypothetical protein
MARKRPKSIQSTRFVNFDLDDRTYQIDPDRGKVYRRFVEIETSKASQILMIWRERRVLA